MKTFWSSYSGLINIKDNKELTIQSLMSCINNKETPLIDGKEFNNCYILLNSLLKTVP